MIRPRMVSTLGVKTPRKVPNRWAGCCAGGSVVISLQVADGRAVILQRYNSRSELGKQTPRFMHGFHSGIRAKTIAMTLHIVDHPLLHDIMARLRDHRTSSEDYRALTYRISTFLVAEATRNLPTHEVEIETPLEKTTVRRLTSRVVAVPVLRAGIGMLQAFVDLVPGTEVGYRRSPARRGDGASALLLRKGAGRSRRGGGLPSRPDARDRRLCCDGGRRPAGKRREGREAGGDRCSPGRRRASLSARTGNRDLHRPPSTAASTTASTSCPGSAISATGSTALESRR